MPQIQIYRFSPKSKPPSQVRKMLQWFSTEVSSASIKPVDTYEISKDGPVNGSDKHLSFAFKLFKGLMKLKKEFNWFKKQR